MQTLIKQLSLLNQTQSILVNLAVILKIFGWFRVINQRDMRLLLGSLVIGIGLVSCYGDDTQERNLDHDHNNQKSENSQVLDNDELSDEVDVPVENPLKKDDDSATTEHFHDGGVKVGAEDGNEQDLNEYAMDYPDENNWDRSFELPKGYSWVTNLTAEVMSSWRARPGGTISVVGVFPNTLRVYGPTGNFDSKYHTLSDEFAMPLIELHDNTKRYIPALATHWATHDEALSNQVFFRLNSRAQWSDGEPIKVKDLIFAKTMAFSQDVADVDLKELFTNYIKDIRDLGHGVFVIETHAEVSAQVILNYAARLKPAPSHFYILDQNWQNRYDTQVQPTSGAYELDVQASDLDGVRSRPGVYVFKKVKDWWGRDLRYFKHNYNFDQVDLLVALQSKLNNFKNLEYGMMLSHKITYMFVNHMFDSIHFMMKSEPSIDPYHLTRGYWRRYVHYVSPPRGAEMGLFLNTQDKHLSDPQVREAVIHALYAKFYSKLPTYGRVANFSSGYGGYDNPSVQPKPYDPEIAQQLMAAAGYTLNEDKVWAKDGEPLELNFAMAPEYSTVDDAYFRNGDNVAKIARPHGFVINFVQTTAADTPNMFDDLVDQPVSYQGIITSGAMLNAAAPMHYYDRLHSQANNSGTVTNYSYLQHPAMDELIEAYRREVVVTEKQKLSQQIIALVHELDIFVPLFYAKKQGMYVRSYIGMPRIPGTQARLKDPIRYGWINPEVEDYVLQQINWQASAAKHTHPRIVTSDGVLSK